MKPKIKVKFTNVSKRYSLYKQQSDKLLDIFLGKKKSKSFYALRNVSFEVYEGETIGVIGVNGSGKSTLSNLLAQVVPQTSGTIEINGQTSLIAISVGLNNNLSGLENIELKCLMLGLTKDQIQNLTPEIVEFADIGDFINQPVKNYSSGMKSRLGFAISVHTNPDILIVDEALSVGDQTFYDKCLNKINEFKAQGKTIFFISHSISQIRTISDKVLWLNYGEIEEFGRVRPVIEKYKEFIRWFNQLSDDEKKNYKKLKLSGQMKDDSDQVTKNNLRLSRKNIHKTKKKKVNNPIIYAQVVFFTLCTILALLFMFIGSPTHILSKKSSDLEKIDTVEQAESEKNTVKMNDTGYVMADYTEFYLDEELSNEESKIPFGSKIQVVEQIDRVYKVIHGEQTGYIESDNIVLGELETDSNDLTIDEFIEVFPDSFKESYQFYLAQLNTDEPHLKEKLNGLTGESETVMGDKKLEYSYDGVNLIINQQTGLASSILLENIQVEGTTFEEFKELAQLKSENDELLYFKLSKYELLIDMTNNTISIRTP